jgi:exodeoxyribonuclease VII small subunit
MMTNPNDLTFEQAFAQLESIVARLESGELALDESVTLYEQGQKLARLCGEMLDSAELRVQQLADDGTLGPLED